MAFVQRLLKRLPSIPSEASTQDWKHEKPRSQSKLSFFRRRIRLKGNSSISIPLGFLLLFPSLVVVLILILVIKHPNSPGRILVPAGTPPSIRYVLDYLASLRALTRRPGKSTKNMTVYLPPDASTLKTRQSSLGLMLHSSYLPGIKSWMVSFSRSKASSGISIAGSTIHMSFSTTASSNKISKMQSQTIPALQWSLAR